MAADGDLSSKWVVGNEVELRTTFGEEIGPGVIFAYDKQKNLLLLREAGSHNGAATLRFLKADYVKEVVSVAKGQVDLRLPHVDLEKCKKREELALQKAEKDAAQIGSNVSKEAQAIFEALGKTMPCVWRDRTIIVLEEVHVEEPYKPENVKSTGEFSTLDRVKKVLQKERARLGLS